MSTSNPIREDVVLALGHDYDIVRELGRGGASVVYLARDRVLGRDVAIKVIRDSQTGDAEAVARFDREARTLATLQHPNIVMLYGARPLPGGSLALIMQHGEWSTLKSVIREQGQLPLEAVQQVLRDVGSALLYLHRHHVIHRDIKPENIFIEAETGRALLSDFGIAKSGDARTSVTLTGVVIGTPAYMSPEQIDGGELTGRSDLYSLGMVGFEMLTGVRPWDGDSLFSVIYKQKTEKLPSLTHARPDTPESLRLLIEKATEKDPSARWSSAQELLAALEAPTAASVARNWAAPVPVPEEEAAAPLEYPTLEIEQALLDQALAEEERSRARKRRFMAAAVVVLLFSGGAGALAFSGREAAEEAERGEPDAMEVPTYRSQQTYLPLSELVATDTPRFVLDEPIVDSGPPAPAPEAAEPAPQRSTRAQEPSRTTATSPATDDPDDAELPSSPPHVAPSLSVARTTGDSPRPQPSTFVEARRETAGVSPPVLRNREAIAQLLADRYPSDLRARGIGGTTVLTVLVAPNGSVERSSVVTSSGSERLDAAARHVAERMLFSHPSGAQRRAVWVAVPLTFSVQ